MIITGDKEFYKGVSKINYEGKESDNPFAYKYYNPDQLVMGKTMREHFKFAIAYWHSFCGQGADPFGPGTQKFPWDQSNDPDYGFHRYYRHDLFLYLTTDCDYSCFTSTDYIFG